MSTLEKLNVPYLCTVPLVFQSFEEWQASELGLHPIQVALQVKEKKRKKCLGRFILGGEVAVVPSLNEIHAWVPS